MFMAKAKKPVYKQNVIKNTYRIQVMSKTNPKCGQIICIKAESEAKAKLLIPKGYEFHSLLGVTKAEKPEQTDKRP